VFAKNKKLPEKFAAYKRKRRKEGYCEIEMKDLDYMLNFARGGGFHMQGI